MLQRGAKLLCVSDLLLLGRATIEEARSLLYWLDSEAGVGKMGVCGLSMGMKPDLNSITCRFNQENPKFKKQLCIDSVPESGSDNISKLSKNFGNCF